MEKPKPKKKDDGDDDDESSDDAEDDDKMQGTKRDTREDRRAPLRTRRPSPRIPSRRNLNLCRPVSRDDALLLRTVRCPLISLVFASTSRALAVRSVRSVPSTRRCCARLPACKLETARCARLQRASRWSIARVVIIVRVRELDKIFAESGSKGPPKKTAAQA